MSELIICEKPKVAEKVAKALSDSPVKNSYKRVPYYEIEKEIPHRIHILFCQRFGVGIADPGNVRDRPFL